jgi:hypothetical protein
VPSSFTVRGCPTVTDGLDGELARLQDRATGGITPLAIPHAIARPAALRPVFSEDGQTPTQLFDTDRLNPSRIEESYERLGTVQFRDRYWLIVMANEALPQTFKTEVADAARRASSARVDVPESEVTLSTWLDRLRERVSLPVP